MVRSNAEIQARHQRRIKAAAAAEEAEAQPEVLVGRLMAETSEPTETAAVLPPEAPSVDPDVVAEEVRQHIQSPGRVSAGPAEISQPQQSEFLPVLRFSAQAKTERIRAVPAKDLAPVHNYALDMWELIATHFARVKEPDVAVEVGTRRGAWASGLMEHTRETRLFCVDSWVGRGGFRNLGSWLRRVDTELFRRVFPLKGTSTDWGRLFPFEIDLVFVDAEHDYANARHDFLTWSNLLKPGGLFIGHDYHQAEVKKAADEVFATRGEIFHAPMGPQHAHTFWVKW